MEAYVLVLTEVGTGSTVSQEVGKVTGVSQAQLVTGPYDVIARAEAKDMQALSELVDEIQKIPGTQGDAQLHARRDTRTRGRRRRRPRRPPCRHRARRRWSRGMVLVEAGRAILVRARPAGHSSLWRCNGHADRRGPYRHRAACPPCCEHR